MRKIPSLFCRNYDGDRLVRDEVVPGSEWVIAGEGIPTVKWDGTACMVGGAKLWKRYDRKINNKAYRRRKQGDLTRWTEADYKSTPFEGWTPAQGPDEITGHWPGWTPVGEGPEDQWHREAWERAGGLLSDGTYELIGPKIQANPHEWQHHQLIRHGGHTMGPTPPRDFEGLRTWFQVGVVMGEGIVWHRDDGRMVKIKRSDFGLPWPD